VLIPPEPDVSLVHDVTYQKLCRGRAWTAQATRIAVSSPSWRTRGPAGSSYGGTATDLLVGPRDASAPVLDSTRIHVETAVQWARAPAGHQVRTR
jgi:aspartate racemase